MSTATAEIRHTVNQLIQACLHPERGFEAAFAELADGTLKTELMRISRCRRKFVREVLRMRDRLELLED